jgi:hypothetical protein
MPLQVSSDLDLSSLPDWKKQAFRNFFFEARFVTGDELKTIPLMGSPPPWDSACSAKDLFLFARCRVDRYIPDELTFISLIKLQLDPRNSKQWPLPFLPTIEFRHLGSSEGGYDLFVSKLVSRSELLSEADVKTIRSRSWTFSVVELIAK